MRCPRQLLPPPLGRSVTRVALTGATRALSPANTTQLNPVKGHVEGGNIFCLKERELLLSLLLIARYPLFSFSSCPPIYIFIGIHRHSLPYILFATHPLCSSLLPRLFCHTLTWGGSSKEGTAFLYDSTCIWKVIKLSCT